MALFFGLSVIVPACEPSEVRGPQSVKAIDAQEAGVVDARDVEPASSVPNREAAIEKDTPAELSAASVETEGIYGELSSRFVRAMESTRQVPTEHWEDGGLLGLRYLERDFGVLANADQRIAQVLQSGRMLPGLVRVSPKGLKEQQPVEKKVGLKWLRSKAKFPGKLSDEAIITFGTVSAVNHCLPSESAYNEKFLDYVSELAWPEGMEWVRFGLYAGFRLHDCIDEAQFQRQMDPFMAPLLKWVTNDQVTADKQAYVLFALAVSDRLERVPSEVLVRFARSQSPEGTWLNESVGAKPVNQTVLGAYVLAKMLTSAGVDLPERDFRIASEIASANTPLTPRGKEMP